MPEKSWSIKHRTVTKICKHEILPGTVENPFQWLELPWDQTSCQINHFLSLKLLLPASGKSSTWKTKQSKTKTLRDFTEFLVWKEFSFISYLHTILFQLSCTIWNLQEELYTILFQIKLARTANIIKVDTWKRLQYKQISI